MDTASRESRGRGNARRRDHAAVMMTSMTSAANEDGGASEEVVRQHAHELAVLAGQHGIHDLRFASMGRLRGRVDEDRDMLDMVAFSAAAEDLLGAPVSLLSDAVIDKPNVSRDLIEAVAL